MSKLEDMFNETLKNNYPAIEEKLTQARVALDEAIQLSEQYGLPFSVYLMRGALQNSYVPTTYKTKGFNQLECVEEIYEENNLHTPEIDNWAGWQRSYC